jgi:excisionase family DNA binding protein
MKAELVFPTELIDQIAISIIEKLNPLIMEKFKLEEDRILTPEEVSDLLKVKKAQIYAWVNESKYIENGIPFLKAGKFLRFSQKEIVKWMNSKRQKNR